MDLFLDQHVILKIQIVPGDRTAPPYRYLFDFTVFGDQRQAALTLRCMKIQKTTNGDIARAIIASGNQKGLAEIRLEKIRLIGFAEQETVSFSSRDNGVLDANLREIVIDNNFGYSVFSLDLANTTISGNYNASSGGNPGAMGVYAFDNAQCDVSMMNTIVRLNTSVAGSDDYFFDQDMNAILTFSADYCILGEHSIKGSVTYASTHELDVDPGLNSTYHLTGGSPAKDAGLCGYRTGGGPLYQYHRVAPYDDIDGDQRPGWGKLMGCDIGADEYRFPWILFNPATRGRRNP